MIEDYEKRKKKQVAGMRSLMDYGIGVIILAGGFFLFLRGYFNLSFNDTFPPNAMDKIFGGICIVYGAWRVYRGYQKKYFK